MKRIDEAIGDEDLPSEDDVRKAFPASDYEEERCEPEKVTRTLMLYTVKFTHYNSRAFIPGTSTS